MDNYALTTIPGTNCILRNTEAVLPDAMTFDEWNAAIQGLQFIDKRSKFWLGDLIIAGEERFGEKYSQALDHTCYALKTLRNIVYTCKNVDPSIRRMDGSLEFGHNTEVAKLPPDEQIQWLRVASENEWSIMELREAIDGLSGVEEQLKGKQNHTAALRDIFAIVRKVEFTAVPKKNEVQNMVLCIQTVKRICEENGIG